MSRARNLNFGSAKGRAGFVMANSASDARAFEQQKDSGRKPLNNGMMLGMPMMPLA